MIRLKKFLGWSFGWLALVFAVVGSGTAMTVFRQIQEDGLLPDGEDGPLHWTAKTVFLALLPKLILLLPLPLAAIFGVAWWKTTRQKGNARSWAIIASLLIALQGVMVGEIGYQIRAYGARTHGLSNGWIEMLAIGVSLVVVGIAGVVVFAPRDSLSRPGEAAAKLPRIAGDGTSGLIDVVAPLVMVAGYWWGRSLWMRWGVSQHLPLWEGYWFWPMLLAAAWLEVVVHESGHALVGRALGMRLRMFVAGPFQWRRDGGNWKFQFLLTKAFWGGGAAGLVPSNPRQSVADEILMIAAGPIASLYLGMSTFAATFFVQGTRHEGYWEFLSLLSTFGFLSFVANLIPVRPGAMYSDGARIYQLLAGGPLAAYQRIVQQVSALELTTIRPREYDRDALVRASARFVEGPQAIGLRLFAADHYEDCGEMSAAGLAILEAEKIYDLTKPDLTANWMEAFVFGQAFVCGDAAAARRWWDGLPAKKTDKTASFYWLAKSALHWSEGRRAEAEFAWKIGHAISVRRPESGARASSLQSFGELRRRLDQRVPTESLSDGIGESGMLGEEALVPVGAGQPLMMDKAESFCSAGPLGAAFCSE